MRSLLLSLALVLSAACRHRPPAAAASEEDLETSPAPKAPAAASEAPAASEEPATAAAETPPETREARAAEPPSPQEIRATAKAVHGVWVVALTESEQRRLRVLEYALARNVPGEPELRAAGLGEDDVQAIRDLRALSPDSAEVQAASAVLERMQSSALEITDKVMRFESGARREEVRWHLLSHEGDTLTVRLEEDGGRTTTGTLRLGEDGTLVLVGSEGQQLTLRRQD